MHPFALFGYANVGAGIQMTTGDEMSKNLQISQNKNYTLGSQVQWKDFHSSPLLKWIIIIFFSIVKLWHEFVRRMPTRLPVRRCHFSRPCHSRYSNNTSDDINFFYFYARKMVMSRAQYLVTRCIRINVQSMGRAISFQGRCFQMSEIHSLKHKCNFAISDFKYLITCSSKLNQHTLINKN